MILLCEECWQRITKHALDDIRSERSKLKYAGKGNECCFYHVFDHAGKSATQRLKELKAVENL